jgi:two-component system OmpR family response regulator
MNIPSSILVVDDDNDIRSLLVDYLETNGYSVRAEPDGKAMWKSLEQSGPDLLILDLNLPGDDGLTLCRNFRAQSSLPVIMLTARSEPLDRILGLEMGADDYLSKPFEPRELLARIRNLLRRCNVTLPSSPTEYIQQIKFSGWTLDLAARHLVNPQGIVIMLSNAELRLLRVFLEHPNQVLNRDQLLNLTQSRDAEPFDRSIDILISRLRQKLSEDARMPKIIKTVRNGGYLLAEQDGVTPVGTNPVQII